MSPLVIASGIGVLIALVLPTVFSLLGWRNKA